MQTKRQIQELLSAAGVAPNRRLGQHFLVDLNLMRLLIEAAQICREDVVLEIGTGTGSLTQALADQAGRVVTVELDPTLAGIAAAQLAGAGNVQILNTDVLSSKGIIHPAVIDAVTQAKVQLACLRVEGVPPSDRGHELAPAQECHPCEGRGGDARDARAGIGLIGPMHPIDPVEPRLLLVSNLPYDVASAVMINLVKGPMTADAMCVTVQKEVAERMAAGPGGRDYGTLSIFLQATGAVEMLRRLKPSVFWPPPGVDSAVVRYVRDPARSRRILDMDLFDRVVGLFIGHRRKMLRACVKQAPPELCDRACRGHPARDSRAGRPRHEGGRDLWLELFERHGIDPTRRPEELSPEQYVDLANACHEHIQAGP